MQKQNQPTTTKHQHYAKSFREHKRRYTSQLTLNGHHDLDTQTRTWCYMNTKYKASHFETVYKETIKNCQISLYIKKKKERKKAQATNWGENVRSTYINKGLLL